MSIGDAGDLAKAKVAIEGWEPYSWEVVEGGSLITGEVPIGTYTRGPKKGHPKFQGPKNPTTRRVIVTDEEMKAAAERFERDTGKCSNCDGSGQQWSGWSASEGNKYRECGRCKGTGVAPVATPPITTTSTTQGPQ